MTMTLKAPFPYFGGKARAAGLAWERFGNVRNYVEPFFGSGAVLFARPTPFGGVETVNDACGLVANFWRAVQHAPEAVASHADHPVNENDLHARHAWLVGRTGSLQARLEGDPEYFDPKVAGWWAWGLSCWIGSDFCSGKGSWKAVQSEDGFPELRKVGGDTGQGVNRKRMHLGNAGQGVNRQRLHLGNAGQGINRPGAELADYFAAIADRLRRVRVCCGDWSRVMTPTPMCEHYREFQPIGVFLDPPYAGTTGRVPNLYRVDSASVAHAAREWAVAHGEDPRYRIALCGYDGEHVMPDSWSVVEGKTGRGHGYGGQSKNGYANANRERIWFSPHCLDPEAGADMFAEALSVAP